MPSRRIRKKSEKLLFLGCLLIRKGAAISPGRAHLFTTVYRLCEQRGLVITAWGLALIANSDKKGIGICI